MYKTWITDAERAFLASQLPPGKYLPPEAGQIHGPNGKDLFIVGGEGGVALLDGRPFSFVVSREAKPLFVEWRNGEAIGQFDSETVFPEVGDLRRVPE